MEKKEQILNLLRNELPFISKEFLVSRIGIFGSYAKETAEQESDVDILIEFEKPIGLKFITLAHYLEKKLKKKIDLLTYEGINSIRNKQIADDIRKNIIYA